MDKLQRLRLAAERAGKETPGNWIADKEHPDRIQIVIDAGEGAVTGHVCMIRSHRRDQRRANADFFTLLQPQTVLALLDCADRLVIAYHTMPITPETAEQRRRIREALQRLEGGSS